MAFTLEKYGPVIQGPGVLLQTSMCKHQEVGMKRLENRLEDTKYNDKIQRPTSEVEQTTSGIRCERDVMDPVRLAVCEGEKLGFEVVR